MNMAIVWLLILLVCLVVEMVSLGLTSIWFAIGALASTLATLFGAPIWLQCALFVIVSLIFLIFTRPIAVKYFNKDRVKTNVESMIGLQAIVISEIDNLQGIGQVTVSGQQWSAKAAKETEKFPVGSVVRIVAVQGVKLVVKNESEEK